MTLSKDKMELRCGITSATNSSIQFGSVSSAKMLAIFMLKEMVQTGTRGDTML